jgi:S-adenosylmethionine hydrolase
VIVSLLTDFGQTDSYVAEVKATILSLAPAARVVDVTHEVRPGDRSAARYLLARTWFRFPPGTVHLVVVDPGVGTARRALAAAHDRHLFVGPDNGVLTPVLPEADIVSLPVPAGSSPTFHGRDVFAPAAARLALGQRLESLGQTITDPLLNHPPAPRRRGRRVTGVVIYVDRFGNLVTNIPRDWLTPDARVEVGGVVLERVAETFGDVEPGALVAYIGSGGTLEIAVREGSAAAALQAGRDAVVTASAPRPIR